MKQVVTITPEGGIQGLQHKKGQGVDLRQFGHAEIERASEVLWHETYQKWYVQLRVEQYKDEEIDLWLLERAGVEIPDNADLVDFATGGEPQVVLMFDEYEEAVQCEIAVLNGLRLKGLLAPAA